jgi:aromatic-L-amino-acid/L-tryptophan decarboxylase
MKGRVETLDPQDWNEFRQLGHRMIDDMIQYFQTLDEKAVWQVMPDQVKSAFLEPIPFNPSSTNVIYEEFLKNILPYSVGNAHPRFWGWVQGTGIPLAMLAEMLASGMNPHLAGFNQAPALVEHQVLSWLAQLMGMPEQTSGLLVSGGTMANILGLAVARHAKAGFDVREFGLQESGHPKLIVYCSTETHGWAQKGMELLGLGNQCLNRIQVDDSFCIDMRQLKDAISADRQKGFRPICVIANAGTVNTAAIDDLNEIASLCKQENLWFHVDGAFGALARLSTEFRPLVAGIEDADSLAFDLHKWMYLPFEVACVLIRDPDLHRATFTTSPSYLAETNRGVIAGGLPFASRGIELTRNFKALKVWMCLKAFGVNTFSRLIDQNIHQAKYLAAIVQDHSELELMAPVPLNIVCLRYAPKFIPSDQLNAINQEILVRLQESGIAVPSGTVLSGQFAIRCAIVNHRSRFSDFDKLISAIIEIGNQLTQR